MVDDHEVCRLQEAISSTEKRKLEADPDGKAVLAGIDQIEVATMRAGKELNHAVAFLQNQLMRQATARRPAS